MSREIKFRAWDKKNKRIRTVDDLLNLWTICNHGGEVRTIPNVIVVNQSYRGDDLKMVVGKDCELMQYTGLKDENGTEIYEGDIVNNSFYGNPVYGYNIIEFCNGCFYGVNLKEGRTRLGAEVEGGIWCEKYLEIIGNIYENPELLELGKDEKIRKGEELKNDRGDDSGKYEGDREN